MCDRIIELYDEETNFHQNKATCKTQSFYILLVLLLITIALLTVVSIYCYLIKHRAEQKHLIHFRTQITNYKKFHNNKCIIKMESNDKLNEIHIKNRTCYFGDMIKIEEFDLIDTLIDKRIIQKYFSL